MGDRGQDKNAEGDMMNGLAEVNWEEIWSGIAEDDRRMRMEIKRDWKKIIKNYLDGYGDDEVPIGVFPSSLIDVVVKTNLMSSGFEIIYIGSDGRRYKYYEYESPSTFYEPEDFEAGILDDEGDLIW